MNLPELDLSLLPDLDMLTGLFGSMMSRSPAHDDSIVILATFIYETTAPV